MHVPLPGQFLSTLKPWCLPEMFFQNPQAHTEGCCNVSHPHALVSSLLPSFEVPTDTRETRTKPKYIYFDFMIQNQIVHKIATMTYIIPKHGV